jgi:hypothetical protein
MESEHHSITALELKKHLADIPDDAAIGFIADSTVLHLTGINPDTRPNHEGEFRITFKACNNPIAG